MTESDDEEIEVETLELTYEEMQEFFKEVFGEHGKAS